jgi:hypothetical protein
MRLRGQLGEIAAPSARSWSRGEIAGPLILGAFPARPDLHLAPLQIGAQLCLKPKVALSRLASGLLLASPFLRLKIGLRHVGAAVDFLSVAAHAERDRTKARAPEDVPEKLSVSDRLGLRSWKSYGNSQPASTALSASASPSGCCGSSVVEHTLGKGEVESSILSRSTILSLVVNSTEKPRATCHPQLISLLVLTCSIACKARHRSGAARCLSARCCRACDSWHNGRGTSGRGGCDSRAAP